MILAPLLLAAFLALPQYDSPNISFHITDGTGVAGYEYGDQDLALYAMEAWERESGGKIHLTPAKTENDALLVVRWVAAGEGRFGEMKRTGPGGRAVVFVSPEVSSMGEPFASRTARDRLLRDTIVYLTCVHEIGHALGLRHTSKFEDVMYYFGYGGNLVAYFTRYRDKLTGRADIRKFSGLSRNDIDALRRLYGARRVLSHGPESVPEALSGPIP